MSRVHDLIIQYAFTASYVCSSYMKVLNMATAVVPMSTPIVAVVDEAPPD